MIHTNIVAVNNFLRFINENWTSIVVFAGLFLAVLTKIRNYLNLSKEEKINEALKIIVYNYKESLYGIITVNE